MRVSDLRSEPTGILEPQKRAANWPLVAFVALVLIVVVVVAIARRPATENSTSYYAPVPQGLASELTGPNKVRVTDFADRSWLSYYKAHSQLLGQPIWGERPFDTEASCMGFENFVVCHSADPSNQGTIWEFLPALLGYRNLPVGVNEQLDASWAAPVLEYRAQLQEQVEEPLYWLGRSISPALCPAQAGECFQVTQRQVLHWPKGSQSGADVHLSPLGRRLTKQ